MWEKIMLCLSLHLASKHTICSCDFEPTRSLLSKVQYVSVRAEDQWCGVAVQDFLSTLF